MKKLKFIDKIRVVDPCTQEWNEMIGNDRVRFCTHCAKYVNDISKMTRRQAHKLVKQSKGRLCIRYVKDLRTNGPLFAEPLIRITRRTPRMATTVMAASLTLTGFGYSQDGSARTDLPGQVTPFEEKSCPDRADEKNKQPLPGSTAGVIAGTVTDPVGAVIPGVSVTLLDEKKTVVKKTTTDEEGRYFFDPVKNGAYSITAEIKSFRDHIITNIAVTAGQEVMVDISLEIAAESVTVGGVMASIEDDYSGKLAIAVANEDLDEVRDLIAAGENVNGREEDRTTPLFIAVGRGNVEIVRLLLDFGAKANVRNDDKETPLMRLDEKATRELVEILIRAGAKVNAESESKDTPLIRAAENSTPEAVQALIDAGAEINAQNDDGESALMMAAQDDSLEKVRVLVLAGADVNLKDKEGESAWDRTSEDAIEDLLVAHGAIVDNDDYEEPAYDGSGGN